MKNVLIILIVAIATGVGIYTYQAANAPELPMANVYNGEVNQNSEATEDADSDESGEVPQQQQIVQDQAYCDALGPQSGNAANSTFFTTELSNGDTVTSGYILRGCVKNVAGFYGNWGPFEGQVGSFELKGSDGSTLAVGPLPTSGASNWLDYAMASEHIPYEQTITFNPGIFTSGTIEITNENPSGEAPMDEVKIFSVTF